MGCCIPGNKFCLLLWKNWLLQKRKVALTVFEVLIPIAIAVLLLLIRQVTEQSTVGEPTSWESFSVDDMPEDLSLPGNRTWGVAYTPNNTVVRRIMQRMAASVDILPVAFADEESLQEFLMLETEEATRTLGGIVWSSDFPSDTALPDAVTYKIRMKSVQPDNVGGKDWRTERQFPFFTFTGPRFNGSAEGGDPEYYESGFLTLQRSLDAAIILERNASAALDEVILFLKRFPYPTYIQDDFLQAAGSLMPFVIMLSFLILSPSIVKDIVLEKERKLKESMKLMGMPNWMHWLAWFVKYLAFLLISVIIMTFCFMVNFGKGAIFPLTDGSVLFVFLIIYSVSLILFCFAISVFFSGSNAGAAAGGILFFLTYIPFFFIEPSGYENMTLSHKLLACLLPNCGMAMGVKLIVDSELAGIGAQWRDLASPITADDDLTLGLVMLFLLIDCLLAFLITWYVDAVFPGDYGVPKPWYFFVTKWYWCGGTQGDDRSYDLENIAPVDQGEFFEQTSSETPKGIQVQGLRKEFKSFGKPSRVAVDEMYLDMYEGQITALLGHNGAGKTTTMFMLTGFIPPTRGSARVNGFDIRTDISRVRENLGLCPQHDVLYDTLTVTEHLQFFARLKGCKTDEMESEIAEILKLFKLEPKKNAFAKSLSGGMKRKLSVGIALIGGSKIVILDEPTSGMDPEARRQTWDILQSQRAGRTIILSTHFMDEADYLGDRIAIMSSGKLICCGSSLFLKKKYGVGYHMVMVKEPGCSVSRVEETITKYVPDAKLESNISAELSYVLPHESSSQFEELFTVLETNKAALGIASFGASVTTMEEVFLKVGEGENEDLESMLQNKNYEHAGVMGAENQGYEGNEEKKEFIELSDSKKTGYTSSEDKRNGSKVAPVFDVQFRRNTGLVLSIQQFWGMFLKKVIYSWRSPVVSIVQLLLPIIFTLFACLTDLSVNQNRQDPPSLPINFSYFESPVMFYNNYENGYSTEVNRLSDAFDDRLKSSGTVEEVKEDAIEDAMLAVADDNLRLYKNSYLVAGYFEGGYNGSASLGYTSYFQNEAIHSPALTLNTVGNILLQYFTGESKYTVEVINHPIPQPASLQSTENISTNFAVSFAISINISFGMSFLVATFTLFAIRERFIKAKHCQFVSGVSTLNFWLSSFTWDLINFMIPALVIMILFVAFDIDGYIENNNLGYIFLLFLLYGAATLPAVYIFSFLFDVAATGYIFISIISLLSGLGGVIVVFILAQFDNTKTIGNNLEWLFYIFFPNFCFSYSLQEMYNNYNNRLICEEAETSAKDTYGVSDLNNYCQLLDRLNLTQPCCQDNCGDSCITYHDNVADWTSPGIGRGLLFMFLQFFLYSALLFFFESGVAARLKNKIFAGASSIQVRTNEDAMMLMGGSQGVMGTQPVLADSDVIAEGERIKNTNLSGLIKTDSVILKEIKKYYGHFLAVDNLSVGISESECFGLLGVNGAGKTTTFKMLTGDESISNGKAFLCGHNVSTNIKQVQQNVGYCPQFDALIDKLTVSETLSMYARLRGVQQADVKKVVNSLITSLLLTEYRDKQAGQLSGGNKRKLSTAIALIGDPPVVFLDEPTTGMDPVARRLLWNTLTQVRESGKTLVLTSHSMEECEALCTRMAIMVNGQFKCLGGSQHLKNKFGEGYTLMAKVTLGETVMETERRTQAVIEFITKEFPGCTLKDLHRGLVMYQINSTNLSWAKVFGTMERAKVQYQIEDYSVSQTTLEQVFINFARAQIPPNEEKISTSAKCSSCCRYFCCCGYCC